MGSLLRKGPHSRLTGAVGAGGTGELERMVVEQIEGRGVRDSAVLEAIRSVPRTEFVPGHLLQASLADRALPIGYRQTISQPYMVGKMTELLGLESHHRVREIGTGSGYQAAVSSLLAEEVYSLEIVPELARSATERLARLGYNNVNVLGADGSGGWPTHAPYDRICLTAAPVVLPQALLGQLAEGGRLVGPIGTDHQRLIVWDRLPAGLKETLSIGVRFVPMTGLVAEP